MVSFGVLRISFTEKTLNAEFSSLDPDALGFIEAVEDNGAAVSWTDDNVGVLWSRAGTCTGLQLAVEELVEALEVFRGNEHLVHVELMEVDEALDL